MTTEIADTGTYSVPQPTGALRWKWCVNLEGTGRILILQQEYRTIEYRMHKPCASTSEWRDVPVEH